MLRFVAFMFVPVIIYIKCGIYLLHLTKLAILRLCCDAIALDFHRAKWGTFMIQSGIRGTPNAIRTTVLCLTAGIVTALLAGVAVIGATPANAKPEFAAQTGMPCGQCHQNPAGGGKLKSYGEKFKANGNKVPK